MGITMNQAKGMKQSYSFHKLSPAAQKKYGQNPEALANDLARNQKYDNVLRDNKGALYVARSFQPAGSRGEALFEGMGFEVVHREKGPTIEDAFSNTTIAGGVLAFCTLPMGLMVKFTGGTPDAQNLGLMLGNASTAFTLTSMGLKEVAMSHFAQKDILGEISDEVDV